ncbi:unnamed protein product [Candida verbasci]|uniref:SEC14 homolog 3 n=1 Tax=Candida verbasci TaxID=1227364 RepID=A0A9W4XJU9_9ASCO|nr:unnamed protein product [Candida verbasci]
MLKFLNKKDEINDSSNDNISISTSATSISSKSKSKLIKCHEPFEHPINLDFKKQDHNLTTEEQDKYDQLLSHFKQYITKDIPTNDQHIEFHPITEDEKAWLTQECFIRYLRASKWKLKIAIKRIEETIIWRRTFGVVKLPNSKLITPDLVEKENLTGKQIIVGYDFENRPCLYLRNGYQNTSASIKQVQHLVFMLETVINFMPPGQDKLALLIDFKSAPAELNLSSKFPSLSISKQCLHILQSHYPERLGQGLFTNIPWIGYTFFKVVGPFIDPYTRSKTIYDQPFENFVPKQQLDKEFNGLLDFEYIHELYWPKLNELNEKKRNIYMDNFRKLGCDIGLSEYDLKYTKIE